MAGFTEKALDLAIILSFVDRLTKPLDAAQRKIRETGNAFAATGVMMQETGKRLTRSLTMPIIGAGIYAVKAAGDYEKAFNEIRHATGLPMNQLLGLRTRLDAVARATNTATEEVYKLGAAGYKQDLRGAGLDEYVKQMAIFMKLTDQGREEAVSFFQSFLPATETSPSQIKNLSAAIHEVTEKVNVNAQALEENAKRLGGYLHNLGMSNPQIIGISGAMAATGTRGQAMLRLISTLRLAAEGGPKYLDKQAGIANFLKLDTREFAKRFAKDPASVMELFSKRLIEIRNEGNKWGTFLDTVGLSGPRVVGEITKMANATAITAKAIRAATEAQDHYDRVLSEAWGIKSSEIGEKIEAFHIRFKQTAVTIGNLFLPYVIKVLDRLIALVDLFNKLPAPIKSTALTFLGITAAIGPVLLVTGFLTTRFGRLITLVNTLRKIWAGLSTITLAGALTKLLNPVALVIVGIAALGIAIYELVKHWEGFKKKITDNMVEFKKIAAVFATVAVSILLVSGPVGWFILGIGIMILKWRELTKWLSNSYIGVAVVSAVMVIVKVLQGLNWVINSVIQSLIWLWNLVAKPVDKFLSWVSRLIFGKEEVNKEVDVNVAPKTKVGKFLYNLDKADKEFLEIPNRFQKGWDKSIDELKSHWDNFKTHWNSSINELNSYGDRFRSSWKRNIDQLRGHWETFSSFFSKLGEKFKAGWNKSIGELKTIWDNFWDALANSGPFQFITKVISKIAGAIGWLREKLGLGKDSTGKNDTGKNIVPNSLGMSPFAFGESGLFRIVPVTPTGVTNNNNYTSNKGSKTSHEITVKLDEGLKPGKVKSNGGPADLSIGGIAYGGNMGLGGY